MDYNQELLSLGKEYLNYLLQEKSCMDIIVDYWIPILSAMILVFSSLAAVIKYYREKNRDFNEKILNEVYAPLYQQIIRQEYVRHLKPNEMPVEQYPIISLTNKKTKVLDMFTERQRNVEETTNIFKNTDLVEVTKNVNFGLAPQDLLVLLNAYKMADLLHTNVSDEEYNLIEKKLRKAIITGYDEYKKKLGLEESNTIVEYKNNNIIFHFEE